MIEYMFVCSVAKNLAENKCRLTVFNDTDKFRRILCFFILRLHQPFYFIQKCWVCETLLFPTSLSLRWTIVSDIKSISNENYDTLFKFVSYSTKPKVWTFIWLYIWNILSFQFGIVGFRVNFQGCIWKNIFFYHKISAKTYASHFISQYIKTFQLSYQRPICSFSHLHDKLDPPDKHPFQHSLVTAESHQKKETTVSLNAG